MTFEATAIGHLAKNGYSVDLLWHDSKKCDPCIPKGYNVRFHLAKCISFSCSNLINEFPYFLNFETFVKQVNPDIIHINNLPFLTSLQAAIAAKKFGKKSVLHVHGILGYKNPLMVLFQKIFILTFGSVIFKNADKVICLTSMDAKELIKNGCSEKKISIIPNGVDTAFYYPVKKAISYDVLWSGRFVQEKGLVFLLKAIRIVKFEKNRQIQVGLIGDGPLLPQIVALAKKYDLLDNIAFIGRVPQKDIRDFVNTASVYVLPSLKEGMPYSLLEAMACGKAVVGSDIPGIRDVITDGINGVLVPSRAPEALADAILLLLDNKKLRRMLEYNARQLMISKYDLEITSKMIERAYLEIINEGNVN